MIDVMKLDKYDDWAEAFGFASFKLEDVAEVLYADEGQNDSYSWLAVGRLKNGLFFYLSAWCDYTGWDCQSGGGSEEAATLEDLVRWRLDDDARRRLGLTLPPETDGAPLEIVE